MAMEPNQITAQLGDAACRAGMEKNHPAHMPGNFARACCWPSFKSVSV
jgi:hypothetical protein